jgi:hypothetical protein
MNKLARLIAFPALALGLGACAGQTMTDTPAAEAPAAVAAPAAQTPVTTPGAYTATDDVFVTDLGAVGILPAHGNGDELIVQGQNVCDGLHDGVPAETIYDSLGEQGWSAGDAAYFVSTAIAAYCPTSQV